MYVNMNGAVSQMTECKYLDGGTTSISRKNRSEQQQFPSCCDTISSTPENKHFKK